MPSISNQATLRTAVADWLNRSDLTNTQLDQFIEMGEALIYETLRVPPLERTATYTIDESDSSIDIPTGYLELIKFKLLDEGSCSVSTETNREDCQASGGTWTDGNKDDDIVLDRVDPKSFDNNRRPYTFTRDKETFLITDKNGEQKASGEYDLTYYYAEPPIGTIISGVEVNPYILQEYELILYAALSFGFAFLQDDDGAAKYAGLVEAKINTLNDKASSAERKGGQYVQAFKSNLI